MPAEPNTDGPKIDLAMIRAAGQCVGLRCADMRAFARSPRVWLRPMTVESVVVGRCRTTLWADMVNSTLDRTSWNWPRSTAAVRAICSSRRRAVQCVGDLGRAALAPLRTPDVRARLSTAGFAMSAGCVDSGSPFARGTSPYDSKDRQRVIDIDVSVEIDGVIFTPGDIVVADLDGVVVIPRH